MSEGAKIKFRKKPIVVEAIQWDGTPDRAQEIIEWSGGQVALSVSKTLLEIFTLEGLHQAITGDWIIKGVQGEFYPCKPDIFEQTYEPVAYDKST